VQVSHVSARPSPQNALQETREVVASSIALCEEGLKEVQRWGRGWGCHRRRTAALGSTCAARACRRHPRPIPAPKPPAGPPPNQIGEASTLTTGERLTGMALMLAAGAFFYRAWGMGEGLAGAAPRRW
jgi:hypothetical protein